MIIFLGFFNHRYKHRQSQYSENRNFFTCLFWPLSLKKCYPLKRHSQEYVNILHRVSSRVPRLRENFNGWWNSGWKTSRDICSHAKMCVPCYASLSDNERNEMRELVLPCYVHPSVRLPAGIGGSYSSPANAFLPCSLVNFTCLFNPFTID